MANGTIIGNAYLQIVPSGKGIQGGITKLLNKDAGSAGKDAGSAVGKSMFSSLKGTLVALGIGTAVAGIVKSAIGEGSELEQNLGGTEAVFGKFAKTVQQEAQTAYSKMGLSASDYMATANKMGSLFQGSGVEQVRAMELSTAAMERAADVASVMGLDTTAAMESIAGAAKGNFTMMDNLGVAMNATTLEAYALEKGINFKWNTADNAQKAELAMQMFMDRTSQYAGNFAKEAEGTFSGSLASMQAAWKNVLANMALGESIQAPLTALGQTISAFLFNNLIPMVLNAVQSLPGSIISIAANGIVMLAQNIPTLLQQVWSAVVNSISGLKEALVTNAPMVIEAVSGLIDQVVTFVTQTDWIGLIKQTFDKITGAVTKQGPSILKKIAGIINDIIGRFKNTNWREVGRTALNKIGEGIQALKEKLPGLIKAIATTAWNFFSSIDWKGLGTTVINLIGDGISLLIEYLPKIIKGIATTAWEWFKGVDWVGLGKKVINLIKDGIVFLITNIPTKLKEIGNTAWNWFKNVDWLGLGKKVIGFIVDGFIFLVTNIPSKLKEIGTTAWNWFKDVDWLGLGKKVINFIVDGFVKLITSIPNKLKEIGTNAWNAVKNINWLDLGNKIVTGIKDGIFGFASKIKDALTGAVKSAKEGAEKVDFEQSGKQMVNGLVSGIEINTPKVERAARATAVAAHDAVTKVNMESSPAKLYIQSGMYMMLGLAKGITQYAPKVMAAITDVATEVAGESIMPNLALRANNSSLGSAMNNGVLAPNFVVNVDANLDGTPIKTEAYNYTVTRITNEQRMMQRAQGAY